MGAVVLGRYRLRERLGAGGFGVVWRAHDELLGREVALKRIALADGDSERASREALAAARLAHPAIVALYEACAAPDAFYLISELVRGETFAQLIATDALDDAGIAQIGLSLTDALAHAHDRGVIHRDVKPQNVLVPGEQHQAAPSARGAPAVAKLTDFGGALVAGDEVLTRTGDVLGTLAYMAPEQSDGGEVGEASDLYSLALILYEAFAGFNPVRGPTPAATARRIGGPLPPLGRERRDLPASLTRAIDRALAPAPKDRGTLEQLRGSLTAATETTWEQRPARRRRPLTERRALAARAAAASVRSPSGAQRRVSRGDQAAAGAAEHQQYRPARLALGHDGAPADASRPARRAFLPRPVCIGCALALLGWQLFAGRAGLALVLAAALAPLALLPSPRRAGGPEGGWVPGPFVCAAALAPVLGLARLAGAFPAAAGQALRWRWRLVLGALGYWWLTLSEPLLSRRLWLGPPAHMPARAAWERSLDTAAAHVLAPTLGLGVLLGAALWGLGAMCLPWIVRGRTAALDVIAVTFWSALLAAAAPLLDGGLASGALHTSPRGAVLGAVAGGLLAVAARALRGPV